MCLLFPLLSSFVTSYQPNFMTDELCLVDLLKRKDLVLTGINHGRTDALQAQAEGEREDDL